MAQNQIDAQSSLAGMYLEGRGVPKNYVQALYWYQKAANQGGGEAQYRLGTLYERGLGVPLEIKQAKYWYQKSAAQGNMQAKEKLAQLQ